MLSKSKGNADQHSSKSPVSGDLEQPQSAADTNSSSPDRLKAMVVRAISEPLETLERAQKVLTKHRDGFHYRTYCSAAVAAATATAFMNDPVAYKEFANHPFWADRKQKPKQKEPGDSIQRWCLIFVFQAKSTAEIKRIRVYNERLKRLVEAGISPALIPDKLKASGGFEGVRDRAAQLAQEHGGEGKASMKPLSARAKHLDDEPHQIDEEHEARPAAKGRPAAQSRVASNALEDRQTGDEEFEELSFLASPAKVIWACSLDEGEEAALVFRREGMDGDRVRFVVVDR